jgi:trk system potassium uptake protein TrkH
MVVLVFYAVAMIRNRQDINLFGRRLTEDVVKKANAVVIINFSLATISAVIIMIMQPQLEFESVLFEVFSAIGTAGMTVGITRDLCIASKLIIIFLMYCGRLGSLSFALVFAQKKQQELVRSPQEKIIVG